MHGLKTDAGCKDYQPVVCRIGQGVLANVCSVCPCLLYQKLHNAPGVAVMNRFIQNQNRTRFFSLNLGNLPEVCNRSDGGLLDREDPQPGRTISPNRLRIAADAPLNPDAEQGAVYARTDTIPVIRFL